MYDITTIKQYIIIKTKNNMALIIYTYYYGVIIRFFSDVRMEAVSITLFDKWNIMNLSS